MAIVIHEVEAKIKRKVEEALERAKEQGQLVLTGEEQVYLENPRGKEHGDYATNFALMLAKPLKMAPRKIAEIIVEHLVLGSLLEQVEIAGPGFINFFLKPSWYQQVLAAVEQEKERYGESDLGHGASIQIEYVSANPTGPVHVGHGRGAAVGSVLSNLLQKTGYRVVQEHYTNDAGNQMNNCGTSVFARYQELLGKEVVFPEDGYRGDYIYDVARDFIAEQGETYLEATPEEALPVFREFALVQLRAKLKEDLLAFGVDFDVWFSERTLHEAAEVDKTVAFLREKGEIYQQDGALWLRSTAYGDDKDRVVIRENGVPTYLAADIAYHKNKFVRGFQKVINIWGADHHGYIKRMQAAVGALGYDPQDLEVLIMQLVTYLRNGQQVAMSKRTGEFVTLRDVVEEIGKDAARYFYIMRNPNSPMEFDLELAKEKSNENPVYYIQYAYARICSILRQAADQGMTVPAAEKMDIAHLKEVMEIDLLKKIAVFPLVLQEAAEKREPHQLARYTYELAGLLHTFYNACHILGEREELLLARLKLISAVGQVLYNALDILGVSAPERM